MPDARKLMKTTAAREFDVAIVGAGPAGGAAAFALAKGGLNVAVLEKAEPPRYKTCGGGVLARALRWLPANLRPAVERECLAAEVYHHAPALNFSTRREEPIVSMVMRDRFDNLLTEAAIGAGAELFSGAPVVEIARHADAVELRTSDENFRARFVVAADGAGSVVARLCGLPDLRGVIPALECEMTVDPETLARFSGAARFDFGLTPRGYAWVFPKREHLSVGVLTTRRGACNLNNEYARYVQHLGLAPITEERHGYMIPGRPRARLFDVPRILLTGDAAGLADPVTAEGISAAIRSGQLAAEAILAGRPDDTATRHMYRESLRATLLRELRVARMLARVLYDFPKLRAWLLTHHGQRLSEFLTRVVMGEAGYRDAMRARNIVKLLTAGHRG